jgi:signal transduction histidine kinase
VLDRHAGEIPEELAEELKAELEAVIEASRHEADELARQASLLGALATAGISTLAYEHESAKQLLILEDIATRLRDGRISAQERREAATDIESWVERARATRALFGHLLAEGSREERRRYRARRIIRQVAEQITILSPGLAVETDDLSDAVRLPPGTMAEWIAIFQNLLVNAANATLDSPSPRVRITYTEDSTTRRLLVSDNGVGVDLDKAEQLFRPFFRLQNLSEERRQLGLGGTGLGLTIVRMLARQLDVAVHFVPRVRGFATTIELSWSEG